MVASSELRVPKNEGRTQGERDQQNQGDGCEAVVDYRFPLSGGPAKALRLRDRGLLREGYRADIAIFDPDDFLDTATYADPHRYPSGARTTVIVNGTIVVEDAVHTGATPGRVLRRARDGSVG